MHRWPALSVLVLALGLSTVASLVPATTHACGRGVGAACARGSGPDAGGYQQANLALTSAYVELDPIMFGMQGFGVQAGLRPYGYLEIGGGAFMLDVPDFKLDEGWSRSIRG